MNIYELRGEKTMQIKLINKMDMFMDDHIQFHYVSILRIIPL